MTQLTTRKSISVCLISGGMEEKHLRLQPWRYLYEIARQLQQLGFAVQVVSDAAKSDKVNTNADGIRFHQLPSVNRLRWQNNNKLDDVIAEFNPDIVLWHLGLPSFIHQHFGGWLDIPVVGIFPGLIYQPGELSRLGVGRLVRGYELSAMHILGTMVPKVFVRHPIQHGLLECLVTESYITSERLQGFGIPSNKVQTIPPGVDDVWQADSSTSESLLMRQSLGFDDDDVVVLYFGSPAPLRGLHTLIRAMDIARQHDPCLQLLILSRRHESELLGADAELRRLLDNSDIKPHVTIISGFLEQNSLVRHVSASDIVALPFELVPSDVPLSILEAQALGKPVVTTNVVSLPELVQSNDGYLARPADPDSLAHEILNAVKDLRHSPDSEQPISSNGAISTSVRGWRQVGEEWADLIQGLIT